MTGSVIAQVQAISFKQLEENRHHVRTIAEVVELCARQGLALRGHRESDSERNRGDFLEILTLISKKDSIVRTKLEGPKYARYTHHDIQNEIIETFALLIRKDILKDVQTSKWFSIIVDDIQNAAGQGYYGASVMSGRCHGVQSLFRQAVVHAIYVHCHYHRLNLVMEDCCSGVPAAARFFALLQDL